MFEELLPYSLSTLCCLCVVFVLKCCLGLVVYVLVPNFMSVG